MDKIETFKDFINACRRSVDNGYAFCKIPTERRIVAEDGDYEVNAVMLRHRTPSMSLWDPVSVVHRALFLPTSTKIWLPSTMARLEIGLSSTKYEELCLAFNEAPRHLTKLRDRLLIALRLRETPHRKRHPFKLR